MERRTTEKTAECSPPVRPPQNDSSALMMTATQRLAAKALAKALGCRVVAGQERRGATACPAARHPGLIQTLSQAQKEDTVIKPQQRQSEARARRVAKRVVAGE